MRIRRIRLVNLNSLGGDRTIDFTLSPLADAGLFAITGATGAGKSTILDALTLALYGRASRYGDTASPPDMMTRHTGYSIAEVVFSVPQGTYRASWELRRARNRPDGKLQNPIHQVFDSAGQALTQKIRDTEQLVAELTGLTYSQFVRSVLLAQGDFAKFLQSPEKDRAALLESLTGTDLYSRIGTRAFEHWSQLERYSKDLGLQIAALPILEDQELKTIEGAISTTDQRIEDMDREIDSAKVLLEQGRNLQDSLKEQKTAKEEQDRLQQDTLTFVPFAQRLEDHRKTGPAAHLLTLLDEQEGQQRETQQRLRRGQEAEQEAEEKLREAGAAYGEILSSALAQEQERVLETLEQIATCEPKVHNLEKWLEDHRGDQDLLNSRDSVLQILSTPSELFRRYQNLGRSWQISGASTIHESLSQTPNTADTLRNAITSLEGGIRNLQTQETKSREHRDLAADHLEKTRELRSLGEYGHLVLEGKPCPLCGSVDHPAPIQSRVQVEISQIEARLRVAEEQYTNDHRALTLGTQAASTLRSLALDLESYFTEKEETEQKILDLSQTYSLSSVDKVAEVKERIQTYSARKEQLVTLDQELEDFRRIEAKAREKTQEYKDDLANFGPAQTVSAGPASVEPPKDPRALGNLKKFYTQAREDLQGAQATLVERREAMVDIEARLKKTRKELDQVLAATEFESREALRSAHLSDQEALTLEAQERALASRKAEVRALAKRAQERVAQFRDLGAPEETAVSVIETMVADLEEQRDSVFRSRATFLAQLALDRGNREQRIPLEKLAADTRGQLTLAARLRELIGSADGAKFRTFAQSLTLDVLLYHANSHLKKLTDRYRVLRPDQGQLELVIQDLHQAGTQRPAASLSGGETFLTSLALALGLSDLAGKNARIDSLFIDEGFGSLDPETLDTALSALETLRQRSKTVGIISHVGLLKERIGVQITVEKLSGGLSTLTIQGR